MNAPRFYCWNCDNTSVTWPHEKTGHVPCKWCGSHDVFQLQELAVANTFTPPDPFSRKV